MTARWAVRAALHLLIAWEQRSATPLFGRQKVSTGFSVTLFCLHPSPQARIKSRFSYHYIEREGGELCHREYLAEPGTDFLREIAERLCEDIPRDMCVTAYNKGFECGRLA